MRCSYANRHAKSATALWPAGSISAIRHNGKIPYKDLYAETLEMISAWAEIIGYDDVWLSEHHFVDDGYSPAQMPIAAAMAGIDEEESGSGTSVVLLPMYDPVRLAEERRAPWTSFRTAASSWAPDSATGPGNSRGWG